MAANEYRDSISAKIPWAERPVWRSIDCGDGWLHLVDAFVDLANVRGWKVLQIKEKFGGLRLYFQPTEVGADEAHKIVRLLEAASDHTCELCGEDGGNWQNGEFVYKSKPRSGGWIKTLCDSCDGK